MGLSFPVASFVVAYLSSGGHGVLEAHNEQPALWVTTLAPIILGLVGTAIGAAHSQLAAIHDRTADLAERVAREWSAEIHESNVIVAKTAEVRSKFFAALSHDMRSPLTAILGFTQLVADDYELDEETLRSVMADIHDNADQLLDIVNDLMDAAKLEAGRIELMIDDIDGDAVAAEVVRHLRPLADEKNLDLRTELRADVPVRADRQRFRQILINLLSNALKYTDSGDVRVRSYQAGELAIFEVVDTGAGISAADMPKVFTPFEQTDVAKGRWDSTGLGLPISLGMAQAMGGTIHADSLGVGHGSTFRLALPAGRGEAVQLQMARLPQLAGITAA